MTIKTMPRDVSQDQATRRAEYAAWQKSVSQYQRPSRWRSWMQIINTLGSYAVVWYLLYLSLNVGWWLTVPLAVLAGGLQIRTFIIFHDCGHGSFFKSQRANSICGFVCGLLTFTPYHRWRWEHARHHASSGNLERRGIGDVWTMTVQEYQDASLSKRITYRVMRHPIVLFLIGPLILMLVIERMPSANGNRRDKQSVWWMNLAVLLMMVGMAKLFGLVPYLLILLIILVVSGSAGIWLFYVQHQFEDAYWDHGEDWDYMTAALQGSSYYKLPKILQWFSGNIGFHHIHHLNPRIPNYYLERVQQSSSLLQTVQPLTLKSSLKSMSLHLWSESDRKLVPFRYLRESH